MSGAEAGRSLKVAAGAEKEGVSQLGADVIRGFRLKSFALIFIQSSATLSCALAVDIAVTAYGSGAPSNWGFGALCIITVAVLMGVAFVRRRYPWNYLGELVFTLLAGATVGLMTTPLQSMQEAFFPSWKRFKRPQIYCLAFYTVGLTLVALLSILPFRANKRMMRCSLCAGISVVLVDMLFAGVWVVTAFCPIEWLAAMMVMDSLSLLWMGFECDRLAARLNPDEYLLPAILVWAELIGFAVVLLACCAACACGLDPCGGVSTLQCMCEPSCDCCVRGSGEKHRHTTQVVPSGGDEDRGEAEAPPQALQQAGPWQPQMQ